MLFFFAGYEIDLHRIAGLPLRLAAVGWAISLALAYAIGGVLAAAGIVLSLLYTGSALATTAIGTLIPVLSDSGELRTRFGTYLLAAGAVGEFGPILLLTLILSTQSALHNAADPARLRRRSPSSSRVLAVRSSERTLPLFEQTIEKSSQLAVRWIVVLVFALALLAVRARARPAARRLRGGRDHAPGAQGARGPGLRLQAHRRRLRRFHPVLLRRQRHAARRRRAVRERVGRRQDVPVLRALPRRARHAGAAALPRRAQPRATGSRWRCFTSTQLPLVLAITTLARDGGHMRSSTAASLVGAAVLSTLVFPMLGLRLRGDAPRRGAAPAEARVWPAARRERRHRLPPLPARRASGSPRRCGSRCSRRTSSRSCSRRAADPRRHLDEGRTPPIAVSAAQQIFGALAAGMITFTGIIFSAVFVAAQIQTSSYSPRLAARLRRDPVVIAGLALPTATATYALVALAADRRAERPAGRPSSPRSPWSSGWSCSWSRSARSSRSSSARSSRRRSAGSCTASCAAPRRDRRRAPARRRRAASRRRPAEVPPRGRPHEGQPAVVAAIDRAALLRLAGADRRLRRGRADGRRTTSRRDAGPARPRRATPPRPARAGAVLVLARQRTIDQDPAFAIRMLVDIAIRALSPAVNDPTTAVQALDRIETLLLELHRRRPGPCSVAGRDGVPRGASPRAHLVRYVELGLTEIRHYGASSVQIGRRLHALYDRLLGRSDGPPPARRARAAAARRGAGENVPRPRGAGHHGSPRPPWAGCRRLRRQSFAPHRP